MSATALDQGPVADQHQRPLRVLRLSLTARCNLACPYCLPDGQEAPGLLNQAQQLAVLRAACRLGVQSLRLTGGEPLLCPGLEPLLTAISAERQQPGSPLAQLQDIALTSNGSLLTAERARALRQAGLQRITISLDGSDGAKIGRAHV